MTIRTKEFVEISPREYEIFSDFVDLICDIRTEANTPELINIINNLLDNICTLDDDYLHTVNND